MRLRYLRRQEPANGYREVVLSSNSFNSLPAAAGWKVAIGSPEPDSREWPEWLDMKALVQYACVSERTVREWVHLPDNPLPASQVAKKLLFRRSAFDKWNEAHRFVPADPVDIDRIVDDVLVEFARAR